jgi:hypothetical protein
MNKTSVLGLACAALLAACSDDDKPAPVNPVDNHGFSTAATVAVPGTARGDLASDEEYDFFVVTVPAGVTALNIQTFDQGGSSCDLANDGVDPYVEVYDASQDFITWSDDTGINWCEDFTLPVTPGAVYYVTVSGFPPYPFTYTLSVRPIVP